MRKLVIPLVSLALGAVILGPLFAEQHDHSAMNHDMAGEDGASQSMAGEHLHAATHMKMTAPRAATAEDLQRAGAIVTTLRATLRRYKDYRTALSDGYRIFLPDVPLPQYHFTNYWRGLEAAFVFDPAKPTSLLYKKIDGGYELLGAMYTAPRRTTEAKLNERVPLSVAPWHAHVNICLPPSNQGRSADWSRFGFAGSISTRADCEKAGGRFHDQIFGWMVHVYPFETSSERIWRH